MVRGLRLLKRWGACSDANWVLTLSRVADLQVPGLARPASTLVRAKSEPRQRKAIKDEQLRTSSDCARSLYAGWRGQFTLRGLIGTLRDLPALIRFLCSLPRTNVSLSDTPTGEAISEHLALTRLGVPRFRLAQGILYLPADFAAYLRGHHRQAVRTNSRRARDLGLACHSRTVPGWTRPGEKLKRAAPVEHWWVTSRDGATVGEAWLTVDDECALLHSMACGARYARWLLHTAIVERLCEAHCRHLITNSFDVPLMPPGHQYFQRLLGYSIARLHPRVSSSAPAPLRRPALALMSIGAVAVIVGQQALTSPVHLAGHRAIVWLTALVAVRVAANRAGWVTFVGAAAALGTALTGAMPAVSLAYFLCALALDTQIALVPRLAHDAIAMSCVGPAVMLVTLVAPAFPTLGHHPAGAAWTIPPVLGAILFGALAAIIGHCVGRRFRRSLSAPSLLRALRAT